MRLPRYVALAICLLVALATVPAAAEKLVSGLSGKEVAIDPSFAGTTLTLFGNIEADTGAPSTEVDGPFDVIIVVTGPSADRVVRHKAHTFGLWINQESRVYKAFPTFYWVLANNRLEDIAPKEVLDADGIPLSTRPSMVESRGTGAPTTFDPILIELMSRAQHFGADEKGVVFQSATLYSARVTLPSDVPNGNFLAETYVFKSGMVIAHKAEGFSVRTSGFEQFLGRGAKNAPFLYGLTCVALAFFTGWLGGVLFKR